MRMRSDGRRAVVVRPSGILLLLLVVLTGGCRRGEPTARVMGHVTGGGRAPTGAMVLAENRERGILATAAIEADGRYELRTGPNRGLPLGEYRMAVVPQPPRPGDPAAQMQTRFLKPGEKPPQGPLPIADVPRRYHSTDTSGLVVTVTPPETSFDIVLESGTTRDSSP